MDDEHLLAEVDDLLRTSPPQSDFIEQENDEVISWLGRTAAVLKKWDPIQSVGMDRHISVLQKRPPPNLPSQDPLNRSAMILENLVLDRHGPAYNGLRTLLFQAQHDLRMKTVGPLSIAIDSKQPFVYFDEVRKIIEQARKDLLFVDPYLDADFVSRYLPQVNEGVVVRLLASKKIAPLVSAVQVFVAEHKLQVQVRSNSDLHDRFVFVDEARCYQSGASFKDGARKSPTALIQITDAFEAVFQTYQRMWDEAKVEQGLGSGPI